MPNGINLKIKYKGKANNNKVQLTINVSKPVAIFNYGIY